MATGRASRGLRLMLQRLTNSCSEMSRFKLLPFARLACYVVTHAAAAAADLARGLSLLSNSTLSSLLFMKH